MLIYVKYEYIGAYGAKDELLIECLESGIELKEVFEIEIVDS